MTAAPLKGAQVDGYIRNSSSMINIRDIAVSLHAEQYRNFPESHHKREECTRSQRLLEGFQTVVGLRGVPFSSAAQVPQQARERDRTYDRRQRLNPGTCQ